MKKNLKNKKAIIIGAGSGIGAATAIFLSDMGCEIFLVGTTEKNLLTLSNQISKNGGEVNYSVADISSLEDMEKVRDEIKNKWGKIDFLINSAGVSLDEKEGAVSIENFNKIVDVNLKGVYLSVLVLAGSLMNDNGSIVNISSIRGRTGTPSFSSAYAAAKAGVINMTKSFAMDFSSRNIRVNCIAPGATFPTGMSKKWPKELREEIAKTIPLKRLGSPEDIAKAVFFLVSDLSTYITGQTIDVNGGAWMN